MLGVRLPAPADHEALGDAAALVDLALRYRRLVQAAGALRDEGQRLYRDEGEVGPGLLVADVQQRAQAVDGGDGGQRALRVDPDVAGTYRQQVRVRGGQAGGEAVVDQQAPDVPERDPPDELLDVDASIAEGAAF